MSTRNFFHCLVLALLSGGCEGIPGAGDAQEAADLWYKISGELPYSEKNTDSNKGIYSRPHTSYDEILICNVDLGTRKRNKLMSILDEFKMNRKKPIKVGFYRGRSHDAPYEVIWVK